jgi:hypothetical protein
MKQDPGLKPRAKVRIRDLVDCPPDLAKLKVGEVCGADLLKLRPTQATVGFIQVFNQARKMSRMSSSKLSQALLEKPIPVVLGPDRETYIIDHHHHAASLWLMGYKKCVVEIKDKSLRLSERGFWNKMRRNKWLHLYDPDGRELNDRTQLPKRVSRLKDNIYQSLAWATRKQGGFTKSAVAVSDFKWPDFFRRKMAPVNEKNFKSAVKRAAKLARSPSAEGLPGFIRT